MAGPRIISNVVTYLRPNRISMNISQQLKQMTVLFDENTFVPSTKQLPVKTPAPVVALCIYTVDMPHGSGEIAIRSLHKNVIMVLH